MKKSILFLVVFLMLIFSLTNVIAVCSMNVTLINQDPFPAVPGDYVEVVFQLHEVIEGGCDGASIQVIPSYPFSLAEGEPEIKELFGPRWLIGHKRAWMIPYKFIVNKNALEGWHKLEVRFAEKDIKSSYYTEYFEIKVKNVLTDFELGVRDYNPTNRELTLEILNIGKNDVEALVIEISEQENIKFLGSNQRIIGVLDSNEDTSVRFRVSDVSEGEIEIKIRYNDITNERRELTKKIYFNPELFEEINNKNGFNLTTYIIIGLVVLLAGYYLYKRKKKK